jgi:hypothetical protein
MGNIGSQLQGCADVTYLYPHVFIQIETHTLNTSCKGVIPLSCSLYCFGRALAFA